MRRKAAAPALFIVWAFFESKWRPVSEAKPRAELVLIIRDQWKLKRLARIRPAPIAEAA